MTVYHIVSLGLSALNIIVWPIAAWMIRNAFGRYTDKIERLEIGLEKAESNIEKKVGDEEWIREMTRLRNEVKEIGQSIARIEGKTDSTLMLATGLNRVAAAIENRKELNGA